MNPVGGRLRPDYACAIVHDPRRGYLLEQRDAAARHAAGRLTCFGGRREGGEDALGCLLRELAEELGWRAAPERLVPAVELYVAGAHIARFHAWTGPIPSDMLCRIPGRRAVWRTDPEDPALSPWHRAVLLAHRAGQGTCRLRT